MFQKQYRQYFKNGVANKVHSSYFWINKFPKILKYPTATVLFVLGVLSLTNPLIPAWFFFFVAIGVFSPDSYYRFVGQYVRTKSFQRTVDNHQKRIHFLLGEHNYRKASIHKKTVYNILQKLQ